MEWCRTRRKGGVSQYLTIQVYDALETLRFGCVFVCKLPIDRRGPITDAVMGRAPGAEAAFELFPLGNSGTSSLDSSCLSF